MLKFPPKRILVPFDSTPASYQAWAHALVLAKRCAAKLEALYVEPWQNAGVGLYPLPGLTPARTRLIRDKIRSFVGAGVGITVVEGDPAEWIRRHAQDSRANIIVMGTHGRVGISRMLLGSVAESVVASSPVPVLIARGAATEVREILAPVCFTSYSDYGFLFAARAADHLGASLTALHVDVDPIWSGNPNIRLRTLIQSVAAGKRAAVKTLCVTSKDATSGILKVAGKYDWVILVAHKLSPVKDAVFGMTAERVLRRSAKPVLVVPPPRPTTRAQAKSPARGVRLY